MSRWGRLYGGTYNHRKIVMLRDKFPSDWRSWYVLIDLAIEVDDDGWIYVSPGVPYEPIMLCRILGIKRAITLQSFLNYLSIIDLITVNEHGILLKGFGDRNFISDCSTERVRKYREKVNKETLPKRSSNVSETGVKRTIYRDRNILKETPPTPSRGNGVVPFLKVQESWNQNAPPLLPRIKVLDEKRKRFIKAAWQEHPELLWFDSFFRDIALSDHHSGKNDKGWVPDISWVLKERVRLQEKFDSLKEVPGHQGVTPKIRNPDCPRCRGSGLYQSGKAPDGSTVMTNCNCTMNLRAPHEQAAAT